MITQLKGSIAAIHSQQLVLDVQGVGYSVAVADECLYTLNQSVNLAIYYHWNQENGPQLFGFDTNFARTVFAHIVSCSGCGPKLGLALLGAMRPDEFVQAIALADSKALSRVSGVGPKKAELMIMQLKDKAAKLAPETSLPQHASLAKIKQLQAALTALHYKPSEIAAAFEFLHQHISLETASFDEILRKALSFLAKK